MTRRRFDLLISDYKLPGITGVELMRKVRARNPDVKTILITAMNDRKTRDEMREAGATAMFDKPIPLADFLDVVERSLGLKRTILPPEDEKVEANRDNIADLLAKLRKQVKAEAVFLLSDRGRILERAGDLYDNSMEVSLLSASHGDLLRRAEGLALHPPGDAEPLPCLQRGRHRPGAGARG